MTLLMTIFAAVISTVVWYSKAPKDMWNIKALCYMYWGASIMWFVDAIFEYVKMGAEFFTPSVEDMINDMYLGATIIAFGLVIWMVILFVKDPKGVLKKELFEEK